MSARLAGLRALFVAVAITLASCSQPGDDRAGRNTQAASVPAGFSDQRVVGSGLSNPTALAFAPDGRLFVCEQAGQLRVVKDGALLPTPFLTVSTNSLGERGLLGVAFDPQFSTNGHVYVYYTVPSPVHNRVSRFTANGDVAVVGSEVVLADLEPLNASNHNGGAIHFGPDGKLYVGVGENAASNHSQSLATRLGKMLRLNPDGSIPSDNPFYTRTTGDNRAIWALGLRNPFTFAFQPGTGRMFINDVGDNRWEEINEGVAGANYGWPATEGATSDPQYRSPVFSYGHGATTSTGCAITGGAFYNPSIRQFPNSFVGKYFFADYCSGWIRYLDPVTNTSELFATEAKAVDLAVSPDGLLYYVSREGGGSVNRIRAAAGQAPSIVSQPVGRNVAAGQTAVFSVSAGGAQPLSYQWLRGSAPISGATGSSYSLTAALADNGATFRVVITNAFGSVTSDVATLSVTSSVDAPVATIVTPVAGQLFAGGDSFEVSGTGADAQDGTLSASAFTWEVVFHHDTHTHPFVRAVSGVRSLSFEIPRTGELAADVWYRIHLTVRDSSGLTHTITRDLSPRLATLTLQTIPPGLQLLLDGAPVVAPVSVAAVVGMTRSLGVVSPQALPGGTYAFQTWSDGGAVSHEIGVPAANTTYAATFSAQPTVPTFPLRISFQPATSVTPTGYRTDVGFPFGPKGSIAYGWNLGHTHLTRERNAHADQLLDTLVYLRTRAIWELELPNGNYDVLLGIGDPLVSTSHTLSVEGVPYWAAHRLSRNEFASRTRTVTVNDGRLTVANGDTTDLATRLNYIEVSRP